MRGYQHQRLVHGKTLRHMGGAGVARCRLRAVGQRHGTGRQPRAGHAQFALRRQFLGQGAHFRNRAGQHHAAGWLVLHHAAQIALPYF